MAASHSRLGAGKYKNCTSHDYKNDSKKKLESFKTEIVRDVVDSLTKMRSSKSSSGFNPTRSKRRKTTELDNFNMDLFSNMGISDSGEEDNKSVISVKSDASDEHSLSSWKAGRAPGPTEVENFNLETSRNYSNLDQCLNESLALLSTRTGQKRKLINDQYKAKTKDLVPITFGRLNVSCGKPMLKDVRIMLDSGSSSTVMCTKLAKN